MTERYCVTGTLNYRFKGDEAYSTFEPSKKYCLSEERAAELGVFAKKKGESVQVFVPVEIVAPEPAPVEVVEEVEEVVSEPAEEPAEEVTEEPSEEEPAEEVVSEPAEEPKTE